MNKELNNVSKNMLNELAKFASEKESLAEHLERDKQSFAQELKGSIGTEIKAVLSEKKKKEKNPPKKNIIKAFFERLIKVCQ